jgi:hypothetical protein
VRLAGRYAANTPSLPNDPCADTRDARQGCQDHECKRRAGGGHRCGGIARRARTGLKQLQSASCPKRKSCCDVKSASTNCGEVTDARHQGNRNGRGDLGVLYRIKQPHDIRTRGIGAHRMWGGVQAQRVIKVPVDWLHIERQWAEMTLLEDSHSQVLKQRLRLLHLRRDACESHHARLQVLAEENDFLTQEPQPA